MPTLQHLKLDEKSAVNSGRVAFKILGRLGPTFAQEFQRALESNRALLGVNPDLPGSMLIIDAATHLPGLAEALDKVVGAAKSAADHARHAERKRVNGSTGGKQIAQTVQGFPRTFGMTSSDRRVRRTNERIAGLPVAAQTHGRTER